MTKRLIAIAAVAVLVLPSAQKVESFMPHVLQGTTFPPSGSIRPGSQHQLAEAERGVCCQPPRRREFSGVIGIVAEKVRDVSKDKSKKVGKGGSSSSKAWLNEHVNDQWVKQAQKDGFRSRAAYKLLQVLFLQHAPACAFDLCGLTGVFLAYLVLVGVLSESLH